MTKAQLWRLCFSRSKAKSSKCECLEKQLPVNINEQKAVKMLGNYKTKIMTEVGGKVECGINGGEL